MLNMVLAHSSHPSHPERHPHSAVVKQNPSYASPSNHSTPSSMLLMRHGNDSKTDSPHHPQRMSQSSQIVAQSFPGMPSKSNSCSQWPSRSNSDSQTWHSTGCV